MCGEQMLREQGFENAWQGGLENVVTARNLGV